MKQVYSAAMRISALNPVGAIFGKELRVTARRKRTYFLRFIYLGVLLLFLLGVYSEHSYERHGHSNALLKAQQQNAMGLEFFGVFSFFSITAMAILGPVLTSTSMSGERLHKTLPVLLMTPLSSWEIVSGKLLSRVLVATTLIGLSLPCLAVVRLLGGVELDAMFSTICLCLSTVLFAAALWLFFSTCINRAYGTIILSYVVLLMLYAIFAAMATAVAYSNVRSGRLPGPGYGMAMAITNPFFTMESVLEPKMAMLLKTPPWWICVISHVTATAVLLLLTSLVLRRSERKLAEGGASPAMPAEEERRSISTVGLAGADAAPPPLPDSGEKALPPPAVSRRAGRSVSDNPVLWRELRRPMMSKRWQRIVGSCGCIALLLFTYLWLGKFNVLEKRDAQIGYAIVFEVMLMLMTCAIAGTTIAQERESDTWTLLLASPVSGQNVVWGKAIGVLRRMMWPMILVAMHFTGFVMAGIITLKTAAVVVWVMISFNTIFIATGTYLSLRLKKVLTAVALNLVVPLAMYLGVALMLQIVDSRHDAGKFVGSYVPFNYIVESIENLTPRHYQLVDDRTEAEKSFRVGGLGTVTESGFITYAVAVGLAHILVAAVMLQGTAAGFNRIVGRAPQSSELGPG